MGPVALTIAVCVVAFMVMVVCVHGLNVLRDIRTARWTGTDPRRNELEVADAAAQVASRKRHPSSGNDGATS